MNEGQVTTDHLIEVDFAGLNIDDPVQINALTNAEVLTAEPVEPAGLRSRLTAVAAHKDAAQALFSFGEAVLAAVPTAVPDCDSELQDRHDTK